MALTFDPFPPCRCVPSSSALVLSPGPSYAAADVSSGDQSQLPLAYDHHAANPSDADKATSQPPRLDKRPGVTSPRAASGSRPRSGPASPRGTCVASFAAGGGAGGPSGA